MPVSDLTLCWATFSEAANQAGVSRRYGAFISSRQTWTRAAGRIVARVAWEKARDYRHGN